ncbi:Hypothetical protein D9617_34g040560 [Elsinoe fawcettii]|nr:Hypothetical protein D9617_34g040560 [Elsinoe fawcettii]
MASPDRYAATFKQRTRKIIFFFHTLLALSILGTWICRLIEEPTRLLPPITEAEGPQYQYGYKYETASRWSSNRRFYLCIVNTALEVPLTAMLVFAMFQFLRQKWDAGKLLLVFLVETAYWIAAFTVGCTFGSYTNVIGGGVIMGLFGIWDVILLVLYRRQRNVTAEDKKEQTVELEEMTTDARLD